MRIPRVRFTIGQMMVAVAVVSLEFGLAASLGRWLINESGSFRWIGGLIFFALINLLGIMLILWASLLSPLFRTQDRDYRTAIHSKRNRMG